MVKVTLLSLLVAVMDIKDYDFELDSGLIASEPTPSRTDSRLMQLDRISGRIQHGKFTEIESLLEPGDVLVLNNSRVIPARIYGCKSTGGKIELLVERVSDTGVVKAHIRASKAPKLQSEITLDGGLKLTVIDKRDGVYSLMHSYGDRIAMIHYLEQHGQMPLPPYMQREANNTDKERYQTVYAKHDGSVAAPTAGLHFTPDFLDSLKEKDIKIAYVTLHVGAGTFQPVRVSDISDHVMHYEWYELDTDNYKVISGAKAAGSKVVAVGTTTVRTLESIALNNDGMLKPEVSETNIFIKPGFHYRVIDGLITNFHLPCSTLLMLVSAFAGRESVLAAYKVAVQEQYRFYSYGDAMFIGDLNHEV